MRYDRFEDLPVWKLAAELGAEMLVWCDDANIQKLGNLKNQLQRAVISISNNIAEGFERGTTKDLIRFLYYARGSAGEVRSMLSVLVIRLRLLGNHTSDPQIEYFKKQCEDIARQLRGAGLTTSKTRTSRPKSP